MAEFQAAIQRIPPVTRTLLGGLSFVTVGSILKLINPYNVAYIEPAIFKQLQLWRPFTAFLMGPSGIAFLFSVFMLYRYSSELEEAKFHGNAADYVWALLCIGAVIILLNKPLQSVFFFEPLLVSIIYLWSKENPTTDVNLFGFLTFKAIWFPWALLAMTLLQAGPNAVIIDLTGIAAAHLYWYLTVDFPRTHNNRQFIRTPSLLTKALGSAPSATGFRAGAATGFAPRQQQQAGTDRGHRWGTGHRLGS